MSIVSSSFSLSTAQIDARVFVTETHTDNVGIAHILPEYLSAADADFNALLTAHAALLANRLAWLEFYRTIATNSTLSLVYQTAAEFGAKFWDAVQAAFQAGDQLNYERLLWWLEERLQAGDITDAQARNSFNTSFGRSLTAAQWTTLRTNRIVPAHDRYAAMLAEAAL